MTSKGQSVKVLIIDDEEQSRLLIRKLLSVHFPAFLIREAANVAAALKKIGTDSPDLVFLDIQMQGETGFDLLDKLNARGFGVIFTTAHSEFAVKAFRYSALDYLMKPLDEEEFVGIVDKVCQRLHNPAFEVDGPIGHLQSMIKGKSGWPDKLTIPTADGYLFVTINDILYCRAASNYTEIFLTGKEKIVSSYNLGYYEELLSERNFFRIHRSCLINLAHIKMYKKGEGGSVVMSDGEEIEISRSNKEAFIKYFKG